MNIPFAHPIAFQNQFVEGFTYTGQYLKGTKVGLDGNVYSYYYGNVTITVTQPFFRISYECWNHGYMGGRDNLGYLEDCATIVPSSFIYTTTFIIAPQPSSTDYPSVTYLKRVHLIQLQPKKWWRLFRWWWWILKKKLVILYNWSNCTKFFLSKIKLLCQEKRNNFCSDNVL